MNIAHWILIVGGNFVAFHFLWWLRGLDGRCREHVKCIWWRVTS